MLPDLTKVCRSPVFAIPFPCWKVRELKRVAFVSGHLQCNLHCNLLLEVKVCDKPLKIEADCTSTMLGGEE